MRGTGHNNVIMSSRPRRNLIIIVLLFLAGCYKQPGAGQDPPGDVLAFDKQQLEAIRKRDFAAVENNLSPQFESANTRAILERVAGLFPPEDPKSVTLVAFYENKRNSATDMAFEYGYAQ
jgi:hypothetical protein